MSLQRLIHLDRRGVSAYLYRRRHLACEGVFADDGQGLRRFAAYLAGCRRSVFRILADLAEESRPLEISRQVRGKYRKALIERRLAQDFPDTKLRAAIPLDDASGEHGQERLLLCALAEPARLAPWLAALTAARAPLAGVYSVSQLAAALLQRLYGHAGPALLVRQQAGLLCESFIAGGHTLLSRQAVIPDPATGDAIAGEVARLRQYLLAQRLLAADAPLPIFALAVDPSMDGETSAWRPIDGRAAAARLGLRCGDEAWRSELLFLYLLAVAPPKRQFADDNSRRDLRLRQTGLALCAAGVLPLAAALAGAAFQYRETGFEEREIATLTARSATLEAELRARRNSLSDLPASPERLRALAVRLPELERPRPHPAKAYRLLSQALADAPAVELEAIDWQVDGKRRETLLLRGRVPPGKAPAALDGFLRSLHQTPGCRAEAVERPHFPDSGRFPAGGVPEEAPPDGFALRLTLGTAP